MQPENPAAHSRVATPRYGGGEHPPIVTWTRHDRLRLVFALVSLLLGLAVAEVPGGFALVLIAGL